MATAGDFPRRAADGSEIEGNVKRFLLLVAILTMPTLCPASIILDQSVEEDDIGVSGGIKFAQTFTVGISGTLSRIEVRLYSPGTPIIFQILETEVRPHYPFDYNYATPTGAILASGSIPTVPSVGASEWCVIDLSSSNLQVQAGEVLSIALDLNGLSWKGDASGSYDRGRAFSYQEGFGEWANFKPSNLDYDFDFRTYMAPVPEPASLAIWGGIGIAGLAVGWRRKRQLI